MDTKVKKVIRSNVSYVEADYEWLRETAFKNRTSMSRVIRYMIHYFRDNQLLTKLNDNRFKKVHGE